MSRKRTKHVFNKRNSITFQLVHRSQKDPLVADETAPQRVLVPVKYSKKSLSSKENYNIFFDNEYNYLQNLNDINLNKTKDAKEKFTNVEIQDVSRNNKFHINLPSSVFESNIQEKVGLLNKAISIPGPQLELDPDIVAALEDGLEFDTDNELEDNFIQLANSQNQINKFYDNDSEENTSFNQYKFEDEAKSQFTEYSLSSSIMKRNKELNLLDNKFEKMYINYDENEIGHLNGEEIEGYVELNSEFMIEYAKKYEKLQKENIDTISNYKQNKIKILDHEYHSKSLNDNVIDSNKLIVNIRGQNKWDCESIISTYSNIYNTPKVISEKKDLLKINHKTGIPHNILNKKNNTNMIIHTSIKHEDKKKELTIKDSNLNTHSPKYSQNIFNTRAKNETADEKKNRKNSIKNYRKQRRTERKTNSQMFKKEKKRQETILTNSKSSVKGICIF